METENKPRKEIRVGDWVRVEGQPGTTGSYIGLVRAITEDEQLLIGENGQYEIEPFEFCTRIAKDELTKLEEVSPGRLYKSWFG